MRYAERRSPRRRELLKSGMSVGAPDCDSANCDEKHSAAKISTKPPHNLDDLNCETGQAHAVFEISRRIRNQTCLLGPYRKNLLAKWIVDTPDGGYICDTCR